MKAILRSINNFSCKLKQSNNLKHNISPKIRSNKFKNISGNGNIVIEDALNKDLKDYKIYGNTYQNSTSGKNLYGISDYSQIKNGVEITIKDGIITLNGTCTAGTTLILEPKDEQILNGNYNISLNKISGSHTETANINFRHFSDDSVINGTQLTLTVLNKKFTVSNEKVKYGIYFTKNAVFDNLIIRPQLVAGTEPDYDYEPYTGGQQSPNPDYPQEIISCGDKTKNLCFTNIDNWESGQYATNGEKSYSPGRIRLKELLKIETGKQYYFNTFSEFKLILRTYDENKDFISSFGTIENGNTLTPQTAKYLGITIYNPNDSSLVYSDYETLFKNGTIRPLICLNSETDKSYEPYGYKIPVNVNNSITNIYLDEPLRKIDKYSDYIDFINGKVVRNIKEIVLDGNENWFINGSGTNSWFYYVNNLTKNTPSDNGKYIISSHYIGNAVYSSNTKKGIVATKGTKELRIRYGVEDTIVNFKTWLQSNNVTVDYVLATPTEEDIELPNINLIEGKNIITIGTEIYGVFEVEYYSKEIIDISNYKYNLRKVED